MSNYPEGSMKGSGIFSYTYVEERTCEKEIDNNETCNFSGKVDVLVDDWGLHSWECPTCEQRNEIDLDAENPANEYDPDQT